MNRLIEKPVLAISLLLALCALLFFFKLGGMALTDPDETFYAQTAKEMLGRGEWITPYIYGKPQFEKPILIYWLIESSYKVFGVNETSARLPSAVFGLLGVIAMYMLGTLLFGRRAGFLSAIILATNVEYIILSRAAITDMVLTVLMLLGALFFFYGYLKNKGYFYILSSAAFALAVLTKGPIAILLPALIFFVFLLLAKDLAALKRIPIAWSILVFILVAGPWYFTAYKIHGKEFIDAFFGFQNVTRFMQSEHKIGSQFYYNIPVVLGGFFPWSVFLPFGFWHLFKKCRGSAERRGAIFAFVWFFAIFLFFSASRTKLPTYVFPSFISLALIAGALWSDFLNRDKVTWQVDLGVRISYYILAAGILTAAIAISIYLKHHNDMPGIVPGVIISGIFLVAGFIIATLAFFNKKYTAAFFLIIASLAIFIFPLSLLVLPQIERYETSKEIAQKLQPIIKDGEGFGAQSNYMAGLAFYMNRFPVDLDRHQIMVNFFNSDKRVWCVIKEQNHRGLYDSTVNPEYVKPSYNIYKVGKRVLVTNEMPEDGLYLIRRERGVK